MGVVLVLGGLCLVVDWVGSGLVFCPESGSGSWSWSLFSFSRKKAKQIDGLFTFLVNSNPNKKYSLRG